MRLTQKNGAKPSNLMHRKKKKKKWTEQLVTRRICEVLQDERNVPSITRTQAVYRMTVRSSVSTGTTSYWLMISVPSAVKSASMMAGD